VKKLSKSSLNLTEKIITPVAHFTWESKRPQKEQLSKRNYQMYSDFTKISLYVSPSSRKYCSLGSICVSSHDYAILGGVAKDGT